MKYRILLVMMILSVLIAGGFMISDTIISSKYKPDLVEINKIKINTERTLDYNHFLYQSKYDFTILSFDGHVIYSTVPVKDLSYADHLDNAIEKFDIIIDYEQESQIKGKILIYISHILEKNRNLRIKIVIIPFLIFCILLMLYYFYMHIYLYFPFKRLRNFAENIATGNLDLPLPMDKENLFGEFTESFDIMREELKTAKQKAFDEERSKKELIASLTHDIKTPIAVIRAAGHLLEIGETDLERLETIHMIKTKTTEVDTLIFDLFYSTMEELSELKYDIKEIESVRLVEMIKNTDQLGKVYFIEPITECLIKTDPIRINQIFGNILSNAYKYADTKIEVQFVIQEQNLVLNIKDFGQSLKKDELYKITNKFYRGKNAEGKEGAGLGLYICTRFLEQMNGSLDFELSETGFTVIIHVPLS